MVRTLTDHSGQSTRRTGAGLLGRTFIALAGASFVYTHFIAELPDFDLAIGKVEVGTVAMALPLAWQIVNVAGWVALQVTSIFENIGVIQEGMMTIARPITPPRKRF